MEANLQRIRDLELDIGRRRRVLDIGSGSGYFLYICKLLGHDAVGLDVDDMPMFNQTIALLGVNRVVWRIQKFVPLPDLGKKFDLITAHMICFNNHKVPGLWGVPEWDFFLDDVSRFLAPGGRIWFELNREFDGTCYTPELKEFFEKRGAQVHQSPHLSSIKRLARCRSCVSCSLKSAFRRWCSSTTFAGAFRQRKSLRASRSPSAIRFRASRSPFRVDRALLLCPSSEMIRIQFAQAVAATGTPGCGWITGFERNIFRVQQARHRRQFCASTFR